MARRHAKLGYSTSDVIDYGIRNRGHSLRRPLFRELETAAFYRREAVNPAFSTGIHDRTPETCKAWAREHIRKAAAWRMALVTAVVISLSACAPTWTQDEGWRQNDSYGTGQRGMRPDGGSGRNSVRETPRAPATPN